MANSESAHADAEARQAEKWRTWAQFVYLRGGPITNTDDELRKRVCETHDAEMLELRQELALNAQMLARQCDLARAAEAEVAALKARLADLEQKWRKEIPAHTNEFESAKATNDKATMNYHKAWACALTELSDELRELSALTAAEPKP